MIHVHNWAFMSLEVGASLNWCIVTVRACSRIFLFYRLQWGYHFLNVSLIFHHYLVEAFTGLNELLFSKFLVGRIRHLLNIEGLTEGDPTHFEGRGHFRGWLELEIGLARSW